MLLAGRNAFCQHSVNPFSSTLCYQRHRQLSSKHQRPSTRDLQRYHRSCGVASKPSLRCQTSTRLDMGSSPNTDDVAIVLVDHGSKRAEANAMLEDFADLYRGHSGRQKVEIAHMELAEPSIGEAVARCVSEGYKKVVVAPYFLSRGRHITTDIPAMVAEAQKAHPEVSCVIAEPIGLDPLMAELIEKRVGGALQIS